MTSTAGIIAVKRIFQKLSQVSAGSIDVDGAMQVERRHGVGDDNVDDFIRNEEAVGERLAYRRDRHALVGFICIVRGVNRSVLLTIVLVSNARIFI